MKNLLGVLFLLLIVNIQILSQSVKDTVKSSNKNRITKDERSFFNDSPKTKVPIPVSIEIQKENLLIPFNLKIYQKILTDDILKDYYFTPEELAAGMSDSELIAFANNKKQTEKMLEDIYGNDLINLKQILEKLGITKDQIVTIAAILKFLLYHPYL